MGYLPEALMNFLGLLSNPVREGEAEILTLQQMVERFELEHVPIGGPIFDTAKLDWINGRYLRERLTPRTIRANACVRGPCRHGSVGIASPRWRSRASNV